MRELLWHVKLMKSSGVFLCRTKKIPPPAAKKKQKNTEPIITGPIKNLRSSYIMSSCPQDQIFDYVRPYHTLLYNSKSNFSALTLRLLRTRKCGVSFENVEDALMTTLIIQNYLSDSFGLVKLITILLKIPPPL